MKSIHFIVAGVVAAHAVAFYYLSGWNPLPKVKYIAPSNFSLGWAKYTDPATNKKMMYQEFTVSTQFKKTPAAGVANVTP